VQDRDFTGPLKSGSNSCGGPEQNQMSANCIGIVLQWRLYPRDGQI